MGWAVERQCAARRVPGEFPLPWNAASDVDRPPQLHQGGLSGRQAARRAGDTPQARAWLTPDPRTLPVLSQVRGTDTSRFAAISCQAPTPGAAGAETSSRMASNASARTQRGRRRTPECIAHVSPDACFSGVRLGIEPLQASCARSGPPSPHVQWFMSSMAMSRMFGRVDAVSAPVPAGSATRSGEQQCHRIRTGDHRL